MKEQCYKGMTFWNKEHDICVSNSESKMLSLMHDVL
jgi:hypothetical protein